MAFTKFKLAKMKIAYFFPLIAVAYRSLIKITDFVATDFLSIMFSYMDQIDLHMLKHVEFG